MKGRAFYQKLERSLVHRLVVNGLLVERVDRLTVDRLLLVDLDDRKLVNSVDRSVLDRADLLVVIISRLIFERWLVDRLIVQLVILLVILNTTY